MSEPSTPTNQPISSSVTTPPPIRRMSMLESATFNDGDFIKPDPCFTKWENKKYVLRELKACLTERMKVMEDSESKCMNAANLTSVSNPQERLHQMKKLIEKNGIAGSPGELSYEIIEGYLLNRDDLFDTFPEEVTTTALGFLDVDLLPNGSNIYSYWDISPFDNLRNAPMLSDKDDSTNTSYVSMNGDLITLTISVHNLFLVLCMITVWIAITVSQMTPTHSMYSLRNS